MDGKNTIDPSSTSGECSNILPRISGNGAINRVGVCTLASNLTYNTELNPN